MRAFCRIRAQPWYRREAFAAGLKAAGHEVRFGDPDRYDAETLLVNWNRYIGDGGHEIASKVERGGGRVLIAENGYIAQGGGTPKFDVYTQQGGQGGHYYALAEGWHNGGGRWPSGGPERFLALGVELAPWRQESGYLLVCPNRSFGVPGRMMPPDWTEKTVARLSKQMQFPVKVRPHPGNNKPGRELELDLVGARAVCIWASSAGVHALVRGIPVICEAPYWICKDAAFKSIERLAVLGAGYSEREKSLHRLAWAQWTVDEIASGEPFRALLQ